MGNFELVDNLFQIVLLFCSAASAGVLALRYRSRNLLILSLAHVCFAMGTTYYVLYLVIIGIWPQVFYVSEVSWLARLAFLSVRSDPAYRGNQAPLLMAFRSRRRIDCAGGFFRPCFRAVLFCLRSVCIYSGSNGVSFGDSYTKRLPASENRRPDDRLCRFAGAFVSGFRLYAGLYPL